MGWKRGYFYSRGGRYVGSGVVAVLAEALDDEERVQAIWERDQMGSPAGRAGEVPGSP